VVEKLNVKASQNHGQHEKIVYALQGGGALGSYQVGVLESLEEAGYKPNWLAGTSIGSINAAIVAGNEPKNRLNSMI
jgi:NTE family protein